jgi:recombinational DNA repair protein RecT
VEAHRDRYVPEWKKSKAWKENEPEMARKTVTAKLCRQLPMSAEFRNALVADGMTPRELRPDLTGVLALEAPVDDDESEGSE